MLATPRGNLALCLSLFSIRCTASNCLANAENDEKIYRRIETRSGGTSAVIASVNFFVSPKWTALIWSGRVKNCGRAAVILLALKIIVAAGIAAIIAQRYLIGSCFGLVA